MGGEEMLMMLKQLLIISTVTAILTGCAVTPDADSRSGQYDKRHAKECYKHQDQQKQRYEQHRGDYRR